MNEKKILLAPEFEYYHSLLSAYGERLINDKKLSSLVVAYDDTPRILEFGSRSNITKEILFLGDSIGNVNVIFPSTMAMTIDENGNATITGATFTLDDSGNLTIS